jgi:hypothetical protein
MTFLVVRIIGDKSLVFPKAHGYYGVEIRPRASDFPYEVELLNQSAESYGEQFSDLTAQRIVTIVESESPYEADQQSNEIFNEVLDCMAPATYGLGETILLQTGFIRNLDTNWRSPRLAPKSLRPSPSFKIQNWNFESVDRTQALLSFEDSELKAALLRSHHWLRRSHLESSIQLKALFLWFAIETLATLRKGENIVPKIMQSLGFPKGKIGQQLDANILRELKQHSDYELVERQTEATLEEFRVFRNKVVHYGFREWDVKKETLTDSQAILMLAAPRLHGYSYDALFEGIETVQELWEFFPLLVALSPDQINDFHGTVLYLLRDRKRLSLEQERVVFVSL